ncbi:MAG: apolipoprotein N-acyltransferase [Fimbriimonadales bacterium]|nr:apolipoprotein N-acyltransferase [Fimbriimonadales bacterium]
MGTRRGRIAAQGPLFRYTPVVVFWGLTLSAVLSALAHPPLGWWWLMVLAPAPLFGYLPGRRARIGFLYGWWWGFVYGLIVGFPLTYLVNLQTGSLWLTAIGWIGVVGLSALFWGLFGSLATRMPRSVLGCLGLAGLWTLCQWLRGLGPFAFVWGHFAVSLYRAPVLLQVADLGGAWGLEFLVAFWNALLGMRLIARLSRDLPAGTPMLRMSGHGGRAAVGFWLTTLLLWALWLGYGVARQAEITSRTMPNSHAEAALATLALVQPNVNLARAYTPDEWEPVRAQIARLVQQVAAHRPALIVLPESLEPYPLPDGAEAFEFWRRLAQQAHAPILVGGYRIGNPLTGQYTNTVHLFLPDGSWRYHDKVQLVPLGETVPFREQLPFLKAFGVVERDLLPGNSLEPLRVGSLRIGAVICMESTYPWIGRALTKNGANLLVVISNESWFGRTAALEQHLAFSVLRAVETRRWLIRCAPEGISAFIAPDGRVWRVPAFQAATPVQTVRLIESPTFYGRTGDWIVLVSVMLAVLGWFRGVRARAAHASCDRPAAT